MLPQWAGPEPFVNFFGKCEHRASISGAGSANGQSGATLPALRGTHASLQVSSNLLPGLQSIAAAFSVCGVHVSPFARERQYMPKC